MPFVIIDGGEQTHGGIGGKFLFGGGVEVHLAVGEGGGGAQHHGGEDGGSDGFDVHGGLLRKGYWWFLDG